MERGDKKLLPICNKIFSKNLADAFSISAMLYYFIESNKYEQGIKYIQYLKLDELNRSKLTRAFKSCEKSC